MKKREAQIQPDKKSTKVVGTIINILLIIAIVFAFICTYTAYVTKSGSGVPNLFGYEPFAVQTDSMSPFFDSGDLVIDKVVEDPDDLEVGDVITFWTIIDGERVLNTHRIVSVEDGGTYRYFVTKGDNNTVEDSMTVHESEVVGIYVTHIKHLGSVLDFLQTSKGFFCIIVLPVFAFFLYYLVSFFRVLFAYQATKNKIAFEKERDEQEKTDSSVQSGGINLTGEQLMTLLQKANITLAEESGTDTASALKSGADTASAQKSGAEAAPAEKKEEPANSEEFKAQVSNSEEEKAEATDASNSEKEKAETTDAPNLEKEKAETTEASNSEKEKAEATETPNSEEEKAETTETLNSEKEKAETTEAPDSAEEKAETTEASDSEKEDTRSEETPKPAEKETEAPGSAKAAEADTSQSEAEVSESKTEEPEKEASEAKTEEPEKEASEAKTEEPQKKASNSDQITLSKEELEALIANAIKASRKE